MLAEKIKESDRVFLQDTDSEYLQLPDFCPLEITGDDRKHALREIADVGVGKIVEKINEDFANRFKYTQKLSFDREKISTKGCLVRGKKNYAILLDMNEDVVYETPVMSVTGLAAKKSTLPKAVREALKKTYALLIEKADQKTINSFAKTFFKEYSELPLEEICVSVGMSNFPSGNGPTVNGAKAFNAIAKELGIGQRVDNGKVSYCYTKPIAFLPTKPDSFAYVPSDDDSSDAVLDKVRSFVDYETNFEKQFISDAKSCAEAAGKTITHKATIFDLFGARS